MGGRGGSSGISVGSGKSAEYKEHYNIEMSDAMDFSSSFALDKGATKDEIGYQMYVHKDVTGRSLISDTRQEIKSLNREYKEADDMGTAYGMSIDAIKGMKAGLKGKIKLREKAIDAMTNARKEYEKYSRESKIGIQKSKKRKGQWM